LSYTEDTKEEKEEYKRIADELLIKEKEKKAYKKKWHPKKPKRKRGLKKGEWKGGKKERFKWIKTYSYFSYISLQVLSLYVVL